MRLSAVYGTLPAHSFVTYATVDVAWRAELDDLDSRRRLVRSVKQFFFFFIGRYINNICCSVYSRLAAVIHLLNN